LIATASLIAEYLTGSFNVAVILNTEVRSFEIIAGNSFAALSSFSQPLSLKDFVLIALSLFRYVKICRLSQF
jgi:membrane-associated protease RseP (regulator of RpoE activity)